MDESPASSVVPARADLVVIGRWALLGTAAGALAGAVIGGIGGRAAMFVLRLTSSNAVRGVESDDGFTIGQFSLDTGFLVLLTAVLGAVNGLAYVACRSLLAERLRVPGWFVLGGLVGGSLIVHPKGVDFTLVEPRSLSIVLFSLIPALGAGATAVLVERWARDWWWRDRNRTAIAMLPAVAAFLFVPLPVAALVGVLVVFLGSRSPTIRMLAGSATTKLAGTVVLAVVAAFGGLALLKDIREVLG